MRRGKCSEGEQHAPSEPFDFKEEAALGMD